LERGRKGLAHIHLAHANLPHCDETRALRLFVADALLEVVTPSTLMKAQGFDTAFLKIFHPDELRVPAGNRRESANGRTAAPSLRRASEQGEE